MINDITGLTSLAIVDAILQFAEKLEAIIGLYLNPPEQAIVLCVDQENQIEVRLESTRRAEPLPVADNGRRFLVIWNHLPRHDNRELGREHQAADHFSSSPTFSAS